MTRAAIELSAATGKTLDFSIRNLGKTLSGTTGLLSQAIPELKDLTKAELEAGAAADLVLKKFAGSEAAKLDTYAGVVKQLSNAFGDLQETFGKIVTDSEPLRDFFEN